MSYDCENPQPPSTCGTYIKEYIGNMEYISNKLLEIISTIILDSQPGPNNITGDTGDNLCKCLPICTSGQTSGCVNAVPATVFSCSDWENIKNLLIDVSALPNDDGGYIPLLCQTINCFLEKSNKVNYGFAAQMERFACIADSLNTRLDSVSCNNKCPDLIGDLLCLLMQIITKLISAVSKAATLMYYNDCDTNPTTGNKIIASFFECMVCDFVNDLCELERLVTEISALVVGFATCDMQKCTYCYTAPSVPRKVRPICPPNIMNGNGYGAPYGGYPYQGSGGCGCKKQITIRFKKYNIKE